LASEREPGRAPAKRRLFFALWPDDALRSEIARAVRPVLEGRRARAVRTANLHITLAFLGAVAEERVNDAIEAGEQVRGEAFELAIDHVESWRAAHVACLTLAPVPPPLAALVERLRFSLTARNLEPDPKEFRAHVTVAREWRDQRLDARIGPFVWRVREFALVESTPGREGSEYRVLRSFPLREP